MREARDILADIAGAGLSAEQMALVMELSVSLATEARPTAQPERSKAALRQERYRANQRNKASQNVTRDAGVTVCDDETSHVTLGDASPLPPSPPSFPQTPNQPPLPPTPASGSARTRGTRLSETWEPEPLTGKARAMVENWPPGALDREMAKFKNYWLSRSRDAARTDWQRTWVNWLMSADERMPRHGSANRSEGSGFSRSGSRADEMDVATRDLLSGV